MHKSVFADDCYYRSSPILTLRSCIAKGTIRDRIA
jgi:hypothetical protein